MVSHEVVLGSLDAYADGSLPDSNEKRDGAHSGLAQYAESNITPLPARESMCGVCVRRCPYARSAKGVIWSAIRMRIFGFVS